jgi:hypothetical protein
MTEMTKPKRPKRDKSIKIRLTADEHQQLVKNKVGDELATWLRDLGLNQETPPPPPKPKKVKTADPELLRQLARIGANLNQIAKATNTEQAKGDIINLLRLTAELATIREQLSEILKRHDS